MVVIAIIGIDGSGKTTQSKLLVKRLKKKGISVVYVRPVYFILEKIPFPIREKITNSLFLSPRISKTLRYKKSKKIKGEKKTSSLKKIFLYLFGYLYVYITCLYLHLILGKNKFIICDRYFIQFLYDIFDEKAVHIISTIPLPDITFYLRGKIDILYNRLNGSLDKNVKKDYYININHQIDDIAKQYSFIEIDSTLDVNYISNTIFNRILTINNHKKW